MAVDSKEWDHPSLKKELSISILSGFQNNVLPRIQLEELLNHRKLMGSMRKYRNFKEKKNRKENVKE